MLNYWRSVNSPLQMPKLLICLIRMKPWVMKCCSMRWGNKMTWRCAISWPQFNKSKIKLFETQQVTCWWCKVWQVPVKRRRFCNELPFCYSTPVKNLIRIKLSCSHLIGCSQVILPMSCHHLVSAICGRWRWLSFSAHVYKDCKYKRCSNGTRQDKTQLVMQVCRYGKCLRTQRFWMRWRPLLSS